MRPSAWTLLAISSVLSLMAGSAAAVRPHYGGTVRVMVREAPGSLEPAALAAVPDDHILPLVFEGLTGFDERARIQPLLALRWQADSEGRRWQFWLRNGVKFHDGSPLTPAAAAASLLAANPTWKITAEADSITIETAAPDPALPAELALPRNAMVRHSSGKPVGTGAFQIANWQPGRRLVLSAFDDDWEGRPFVDSLEITLGQNWRQQMIMLELARADVVEVAPSQVRRAALDGKRIFASAPDELIALVFARDPQSEDESRQRQALSAAIDRASIASVLLQGQGESANAILPNWMTGYAFLFARDRTAMPASSPQPGPAITLSYDPADPSSQLIAQRVALNARDAGINLQPATSTIADARLVSLSLPSPDPQVALAAIAASAGLPVPQLQGSSPDELYAREQQMLQSGRIIPLVHVPQAAAVAPNLQGWRDDQFGVWRLADVWLEAPRP